MKRALFSIIVLSQLALSCKKNLPGDGFPPSLPGKPLKIAVVSDIHYMDPSLLGTGGAAGLAFQNYLNQDPKLVEYSAAIFKQVLSELKKERPDILLVPGDITKDGEKIGHQAMAGFFNELERLGVKVYVVPGNHDINNAKAKKYIGDNDYPVTMTTPSEFANIYGNFGYNNAISRDANSLSYVAQVQPGLRLIAIDASKYEEYGPSGDVAEGRIKPATLTWILNQLALAKMQHVQVFAMMHHNLIEHYTGQSQLDPGYVVDDWQTVADTLIQAGLKVIFTGHYHANDISSYTYKGNKLFDIETGSLVTAPIPYRMITLKGDRLDIKTNTVQSIAAALPHGVSFPEYSNAFLSQHLDGYFNYFLTNAFGAPQDLAAFAAPMFRNGIMAHFAGDESIPADQQQLIQQLAGFSPQLAGIVTTLWTDTGEIDNNTVLQY
ncbi:MAG: metallophosphoesterase [Chitinophagaceae bacterium]